MLLTLCKAIASTPVLKAGTQEGLEAWRILVLQHEPTSLTRGAGLLQEFLHFSFDGEIGGRLAQFDRDVDRCEKASLRTTYQPHSDSEPLKMCLRHANRLTERLV